MKSSSTATTPAGRQPQERSTSLSASRRAQRRMAFWGVSTAFVDELSYAVNLGALPPLAAMEGEDALQLEELSAQFH